MEKEKDFLKKIFGKGIKNEKILLVLLVAALLLVLALPVADNSSGNAAATGSESNIRDDDYTWYQEYLEKRLTKLLTQTYNIGKVEVMITLKNTTEKVLETEGKEDDKSVVRTEEQNRKIPYVVQEKMPQVAGVVVVAQNGDNPGIISEITQAVEALLSVSTHRIKVLKMK